MRITEAVAPHVAPAKVHSSAVVTWADEGWPATLDRWEVTFAATGDSAAFPLRQAPATEGELRALEARIGKPLPPSYRSFLSTTNGLQVRNSADEKTMDWFVPTTRVQTVRAGQHLWLSLDYEAGIGSLFDIDGNVAAQLLNPGEYSCRGHLLYAIKVDNGYPESSVFLDPLDVDADGEWRAWDQYKEICPKYRSFGDLFEDAIKRSEQPTQPEYYKHLVDPSPEAAERLRLEALLEVGGSVSEQAMAQLVKLATEVDASPQARASAFRVLLGSQSSAAREAVLRLIETQPDDTVIVGNALAAGYGRERSPRLRAALFRALTGPTGRYYASRLVWTWPELVDDAWNISRDQEWLSDLLNAGRPGSMTAAIEALGDPSLPAQTRDMLVYTLGYSSRPSDPSLADAVVRLAAVPENNRLDLARALLGWGETDKALSLLDESLEQPNAHGAYLFMKLNERPLPQAVPLLVASLRRKPTAHVLHALAFVDHADSAPELARHLNGELRDHALLALEEMGTPAALSALAAHADDGDLEAARALARRRDERALHPLMRAVGGAHHRSAVTGLRDLRHQESKALLARIAAEDPDDNVAVIAAHGLVMAGSEQTRQVVEGLGRRSDRDIRKLADHWLRILP
jgi:hypothetical protein